MRLRSTYDANIMRSIVQVRAGKHDHTGCRYRRIWLKFGTGCIEKDVALAAEWVNTCDYVDCSAYASQSRLIIAPVPYYV